MAAINQEAIQELKLVLDILMPTTLASGVTAITTLTVISATPTGIGGFIETNPGGTAYIYGLRIDAQFGVILRGNNLSHLRTSVDTVIEALLGADKEALRTNGILKLTQTGNDYQALSGADQAFKLTFALIYEYHQLPEEIEDVITEIPIHLSLDS